jgi:hypothetical protein
MCCDSLCFPPKCSSCLGTLPQRPVIPQDAVESSIYISVISQEKNDLFYTPVPLGKAWPHLGLRKIGRKFLPVPEKNDVTACNERRGKYSHILDVSIDERLLLNGLN